MTAPWFAHRFPPGHPRSSMAPASAMGWLVLWLFVAFMALGAVAFATLALFGFLIAGALAFAGLAAIGAGAFIYAAQTRGDHTRTVADLRNTHADN